MKSIEGNRERENVFPILVITAAAGRWSGASSLRESQN